MTPDSDRADRQILLQRLRQAERRGQTEAARPEEAEDWSFLSMFMAGLGLVVLANTFVRLF
jgi:hypothetical protein